MNIIKELRELEKICENHNYGYDPGVAHLVGILLKYFREKEKEVEK